MDDRLRVAAEIGLFALVAIGLLAVFALTGRRGDRRELDEALADIGSMSAPRPTEAVAPVAVAALPSPTDDASLPVAERGTEGRVGIVVGHWQYDTGAICPDGLQEVDVTLDVATRVEALLNAEGYSVDLLPEHDPDRPAPPLQNYRGAALVSLHADSCDITGASGFKVARWRFSNIPEADDLLVDCLNEHYAAATLLPRHEDSITIDMWNYYAFREVAEETPAAIVELAFLLDDRDFVDEHRYEMARGVADGIRCFLEDD